MKNKTKTRIIGTFILIIAMIFFFSLLLPMITSLAYLFLTLLKLYPSLPLQYKFAGGCFFLIIYWYILNAIANIWFKFLMIGLRKIK